MKQGSTKQLVEQKKAKIAASSNSDSLLLTSNVSLDEKEWKEFDLDTLHEHNLKIFGDVFESLIGAVFLDSFNVLYK